VQKSQTTNAHKLSAQRPRPQTTPRARLVRPGMRRAVEQFHANSRLHFIGSWRGRYEEFLDAKERERTHEGPKNPYTSGPRVVFHVDMDCFFASVATRDDADLRARPVAVSWGTTTSARGEISSANYVARDRGVRAGMWIDDALAVCPDLVTVPYDFKAYESVALEVYEILWRESDGECMGVSCDEAYVDVSGRCADGREDPMAVAEEIRRQIFEKTRCTCSIGIGSNVLLARLATKRAKPNRAFRVTPEEERRFIATTAIEDIPGVGRSAAEKLKIFGAKSCEELLRVPANDVKGAIGAKLAEKLLAAARGIDKTPWRVRPDRKSVGAQMSWGVRCATDDIAYDFIRQLVNEVSQRMQRLRICGERINLKLWRAIPEIRSKRGDYQGHGACDILTRSKQMREMSNDTELIASEALALFRELRVEASLIRGLGVSITKLEGDGAATSPGSKKKQQPTLSQMFRGRNDTTKVEEDHSDDEVEDIAETETEGEEEDVANTQLLTQNECDVALFHDSQAEMDSDMVQSIRDAFSAAARAYAWQRHELGRLKLSKRRRDTLSEDEYAKRAVMRAADVIAAHARRSFLRDGLGGLSHGLDDARALCRAHELLNEKYSSQGAAFIAAWLERLDNVETVVSGG